MPLDNINGQISEIDRYLSDTDHYRLVRQSDNQLHCVVLGSQHPSQTLSEQHEIIQRVRTLLTEFQEQQNTPSASSSAAIPNNIIRLRNAETPEAARNVLFPQSSSTTMQQVLPEGSLQVQTTRREQPLAEGILGMMPAPVQALIGANYVENFQDVMNFITQLPLDQQAEAFCSMMNPTSEDRDANPNVSNASSIIVNHILQQTQFNTANVHTDAALNTLFNNLFPVSLFSTADARARFIEGNLSSAIQAFTSAMRELRSLDCSGFTALTDAQLRAIATHFPKLQSLDVRGCRNVSGTGIQAITTNCPNCRIIR